MCSSVSRPFSQTWRQPYSACAGHSAPSVSNVEGLGDQGYGRGGLVQRGKNVIGNRWRPHQERVPGEKSRRPMWLTKSGERRRHNRRKPHTNLRAVSVVKKRTLIERGHFFSSSPLFLPVHHLFPFLSPIFSGKGVGVQELVSGTYGYYVRSGVV